MSIDTNPIDQQTDTLARRIVAQYRRLPADRRLLVAVAGRPGSGKSTLAYPLADRVNELILGHAVKCPVSVDDATALAHPNAVFGDGDEVAICVGLDGWHYTRAQLDCFPDPKLAHWRRGASWTFNLDSYAAFIRALRVPLLPTPPAPIPFPTFDHARKDPTLSPIPVLPQHRIVIVEGLYTMLAQPGWIECAKEMDMRVWVEVPRRVVLDRVLKRNAAAGITLDMITARKRVEQSDMVNGDTVFAHRYSPTDTLDLAVTR